MTDLDLFFLRAPSSASIEAISTDVIGYADGVQLTNYSTIAPLGPFLPGMMGGLQYALCGADTSLCNGYPIVVQSMDWFDPHLPDRKQEDRIEYGFGDSSIWVEQEIEIPEPDELIGDWKLWKLPPSMLRSIAELTDDRIDKVVDGWRGARSLCWFRGENDRRAVGSSVQRRALAVLRELMRGYLDDGSQVVYIGQATEERDADWIAYAEWGRPEQPELVVNKAAQEGAKALREHIWRERDPELVARKLEIARAQDRNLPCEACRGPGALELPSAWIEIAEVHHRIPLASAVGPRMTSLKDLAVLCPNCHTAIHKTNPMIAVELLREYFGETSDR